MPDPPPYEITLRLTHAETDGRCFVAIARDISERLELERTKSAFIATVSHELRSPLTSIKGGIGLVLSGAAGDVSDRARGLLEISHRNADRLVLIVNDMLDLEKIAAGRMTFDMRQTDGVALIREALNGNGSYLDQFGVDAHIEGLDRPAWLTCDPDRVLQVLGNLLTNAAKFSIAGQQIRIALQENTENITFTVQDFGIGIPKKAQGTIFERFTQANCHHRGRADGTGLGLSIMKAIVESHSGRVDMDSTEGKGTTFHVTLPKRQPGESNAFVEIQDAG